MGQDRSAHRAWCQTRKTTVSSPKQVVAYPNGTKGGATPEHHDGRGVAIPPAADRLAGMYCDVCGHLIRPGQRPLLTSSAADPTIVFVDVCSDECAVTVRAERNEAVRERVA